MEGENIKRIREAKGMTQAELAKLVNVSDSMICQIERGTKTVTLPLAKEIAVALEVDISDL